MLVRSTLSTHRNLPRLVQVMLDKKERIESCQKHVHHDSDIANLAMDDLNNVQSHISPPPVLEGKTTAGYSIRDVQFISPFKS